MKDPSCFLCAGKHKLRILVLNMRILALKVPILMLNTRIPMLSVRILMLNVQTPGLAWPSQCHPGVTPPAALLLCLTSGKDREQI